MNAVAAERRAQATAAKGTARREQNLQSVLDAISAMGEADRALAERSHAIVTEVAPELEPKTWYGMPAYAKDGKALCFFQAAGKFNARYATFGFNDNALLDVVCTRRVHGCSGNPGAGAGGARRGLSGGRQLCHMPMAIWRCWSWSAIRSGWRTWLWQPELAPLCIIETSTISYRLAHARSQRRAEQAT